MKFSSTGGHSAAQIEREASLWVVRCERGLTPAEQDDFLQWKSADQRHGREFALQRDNWARLGVLADWRPEHSPRPNRDLLAPPPASNIVWLRAHRTWVASAALAAAAVALGLFLVRTGPMVSSPALETPVQIASIEERVLADGSTITLNRGAEVSVHYAPEERRVRLDRGEAHFDVASIPGRPFIVSVHGIDVRAVGTAFNVRIETEAVEVLVTEGRVQVRQMETVGLAGENPAGTTVMEPSMIEVGQRGVISLGPNGFPTEISAVTAEQIQALIAWKPTFLDFTDTPLQSIVSEFNRRNAPVRISISDPSLAQTEVSASLRSDNIEGFIRLLEVGFGVEAERLGSTVSLRRARTSERSRDR